jgi:hypothetical protein
MDEFRVIYNSRENIFRTTEISDVFYSIHKHFLNENPFHSWLDIILPELQHGAKFIFDISHESPLPHRSFYVYHDENGNNFLDWILRYIEKNNLNKDDIQIWTGVLNVRDLSPKKYQNILFGRARFNNYPHRSTDINFLEKRKFEKKFSIMLGRLISKQYRIDLYENLKENNLLSNCFYSFNTLDTIEGYPKIHMESPDEIANINYDFPRSGEEYFKKSPIHIVVETLFREDDADGRIVFTEKIFRAINSCQSFILVSTYKSLENLKELGFKTFDKWWDESYDNEIDDDIRLEKIQKLVLDLNKMSLTDLTNMYIEMIPVITHNFNLSLNFNKHEKGNPVSGIFEHITGEENVFYKMCLPNSEKII